MNLLGYTISLKTILLLLFLYGIVIFNLAWSCVISPCIESMKNPNLQQLIKANIKKTPFD